MTSSPEKKQVGLFDIVGDISFGKSGIFYDDPENESAYVPYMINLAFSQHLDSILWANYMNMYPSLPKSAQHDFFFFGLEARKRFGKWAKKAETPEALEIVKEFYSISDSKASDILSFISQESLEKMKAALNKGGKKR